MRPLGAHKGPPALARTESAHPSQPAAADVVLLTDFGTADWYAATMKGVIRSIAPRAGLIDLTHEIAPGNIDQAGFVLAQAAPYFPAGTVFCVVVDPGVGTARRPLACHDGERFFVAPDNGVLSGVARAAGANWRCHEASNPQWRRADVSATFHGRDVFAPVSAWLTRIPDLALCGPPVEHAILLPEEIPEPTGLNSWRGRVLHVDRFGNAITSFHRQWPPFNDASHPVKAARTRIELVNGRLRGIHPTYADVAPGEPLAYWGSAGYLEIAVNLGNAAESLGIRPADPVLISVAY